MKNVVVQRSDGKRAVVPVPKGVNMALVKRYLGLMREAATIEDGPGAPGKRMRVLGAMDRCERSLTMLESAFIANFMEAFKDKAAAAGGEVDGGEAKAEGGGETA